MEIPFLASAAPGPNAGAEEASPEASYRVDSDLHCALSSSLSFADLVEHLPQTRATFVQPGQKLVVDAVNGTSDRAGGRTAVPDLLPGPGVVRVQSAAGQRFAARDFGYLYVAAAPNGSIEVGLRSPIEVGLGDLRAEFLCLPCTERSHNPSSIDVQRIVATHGICCGIDPSACVRVSAVLGDPNAHAQVITVARGRLPRPGRDGRVVRADGDTSPPSPLLDPVWPTGMSVDKGGVLAVLETATPGEPGYTIAGDRLTARKGKPVSLSAGNHVEVENLHGTRYLFRATADGFVVFWAHTVEVVPLSAE